MFLASYPLKIIAIYHFLMHFTHKQSSKIFSNFSNLWPKTIGLPLKRMAKDSKFSQMVNTHKSSYWLCIHCKSFPNIMSSSALIRHKPKQKNLEKGFKFWPKYKDFWGASWTLHIFQNIAHKANISCSVNVKYRYLLRFPLQSLAFYFSFWENQEWGIWRIL